MKKLVKGNEAIVIGSLVAGCDAFFGYPITPASEISHKAADYYRKLGKIFLQAESEIGAINMVFGAGSCGLRTMTASSGPGVSLKQECISYLAGAEIPAVIADIMRAGPGLGNIGSEQSDYFQVIKGGGHGSYRVIVLAPNSVEEMYDFTIQAFSLADRYRIPVYVLADATLGQMMEPINVHKIPVHPPKKNWKLDSTAKTNQNLITSIYLDFNLMEKHIRGLEKKYKKIEENEQRAETYFTEDADLILTGYGIVSRLLLTIVKEMRLKGKKVGLFRPQTLWPFPENEFKVACKNSRKILVVELSLGQYVEDVRLHMSNMEVEFYGRVGGNLPTKAEIVNQINIMLKR